MLGPIAAVTIATRDVDAHAALYARWLGYGTVERRAVGPAEAAAWGAPAAAGRACALLAPAGDATRGLVRFVETRLPDGYRPFRHLGWNAAEHLVQDCDALASRLAGSPFEIVGPPADLSFTDRIRAMQVRGPADEVLYLTQIKGPIPGLDLPQARHPVDHVFIAILGGESMTTLQDGWHERLGVPRAAAMPSRISVLARAWGHPPETRYTLAALPLRGACYVEADEMPAGVEPRPRVPDELPPAIAMVSFATPRLIQSVDWIAPPVPLPDAPYFGRAAGSCRGPAGEWIELIADA